MTLTRIPEAKAGMLIRKPAHEVFEALADPALTTRFWYSMSTGPMTPGARLEWSWEFYGVSATIKVKEVEQDRRIVFEWNEDNPTTVDLRFIPWDGDATFVSITETGLTGSDDDMAAYATATVGGFTTMLCALKALLEHGVVLDAVRDHHPAGVADVKTQL